MTHADINVLAFKVLREAEWLRLQQCEHPADQEAFTTHADRLEDIWHRLHELERDRKRAFLSLEQVPFHAVLKAVVE